MRVDVFSDVVCPWCFIGKRHLESALVEAQIPDADIHWHAFQLNPDLPAEGRDRIEYMREKFGEDANTARMHDRITEAGKQVDIEFQFDKIRRSPNTFNAHRLLQLAQSRKLGNALVETLFRGYFTEGRDVGDSATLVELGHAAGLQDDLPQFLASEEQAAAVRNDLDTARQIGVGGVPFFILDGRYTLSGAQPVALFVQALQATREKSRGLN